MPAITKIGGAIEAPLSITSDLIGAKAKMLTRQASVNQEITSTMTQTKGAGVKFVKEITIDPLLEQVRKFGESISKYVGHVKQKALDMTERKEIAKELMTDLQAEKEELRAQKKLIDKAYKDRASFIVADNARIAEENAQYAVEKSEILDTVHSYRTEFTNVLSDVEANKQQQLSVKIQRIEAKAQIAKQIESLRQQIANLEQQDKTITASFDGKIQDLKQTEQAQLTGLDELKGMISDLLAKL